MPSATSSKSAVLGQRFTIPLINFSDFLNPPSSEDRLACCKSILEGFKTAGFVYLKSHGIPKSQITAAFQQSAHFFARPQQQKDALEWLTPESNRGYMRMGREKVSNVTDVTEASNLRQSNPDMKETIDVGREGVEGSPNQWPDTFDTEEHNSGTEFKKAIYDLWTACKALNENIMSSIAIGMGYDAAFFDEYISGGDNNLRLLHYPAVEKEVFGRSSETMRAGAHCDLGTITLLFQDDCGGLEVKSPAGEFVPATPIEGTVVVNAGDLLARWTNDLIKSSLHRVVRPTQETDGEMYPERFSIAYFCNPNFDKIISALPRTFDDSNPKKYQNIKSGDYVMWRLGTTVAKS